MHSSMKALGILAACLAGVSAQSALSRYRYGTTFFIGPPSSKSNYITSISYNLDTVLGVPTGYDLGSNSTDDPIWVSPWIGVEANRTSSNGTLVQPILFWQDNQAYWTGCKGATLKDWCFTASTYQPAGRGVDDDEQREQSYHIVPASAKLGFSIKITKERSATQRVAVNGKVITKQTDIMDALPLYVVGTTECYTGSGKCGSIEAHTWTNVTVQLAEADPTFGTAGDAKNGTRVSLTSSDKGLTWFGTVQVPAFTFS